MAPWSARFPVPTTAVVVGGRPPPVTAPKQPPPCLVDLRGSEHIWLLEAIHHFSPRGLVLDVGANQAGTSVVAALLGHQVVAFEAIRENAEAIPETLEGVQLDRNRVLVVNAAVWDKVGLTKTFDVQTWAGRNGQMLRESQLGKAAEKEQVLTTTIDEHIREDVLLMKVDVEGCELNAMLGARRLLTERRVPFVVLEFSTSNIQDISGTSSIKLLELMHGMGYETYLHVCHWGHRSHFPYSCALDPKTLVYELINGGPLAEAKHIPRHRFQHFLDFILRQGGGKWQQVDLLFYRGRDVPLAPSTSNLCYNARQFSMETLEDKLLAETRRQNPDPLREAMRDPLRDLFPGTQRPRAHSDSAYGRACEVAPEKKK